MSHRRDQEPSGSAWLAAVCPVRRPWRSVVEEAVPDRSWGHRATPTRMDRCRRGCLCCRRDSTARGSHAPLRGFRNRDLRTCRHDLLWRDHFVVVAVVFEQDSRCRQQFLLGQFAVAVGVQQLEQCIIDLVLARGSAATESQSDNFFLLREANFDFIKQQFIPGSPAATGRQLEWRRADAAEVGGQIGRASPCRHRCYPGRSASASCRRSWRRTAYRATACLHFVAVEKTVAVGVEILEHLGHVVVPRRRQRSAIDGDLQPQQHRP